MSAPARVLLVDPDADDRRLASLVLGEALPGAAVVEAGTAIAFAEQLAGGTCDAVVTEMDCGWAQAPELLAVARRRWPECVCLVFSRLAPERLAASAQGAGAHGWLHKDSAGFLALPRALAEARDRERAQATPAADSDALQELVYAVSHDLQEPLQHLTRYVALLGEHLGESVDADAAGLLGHLGDSAQRLQEMVDSVLEYARLDAGEGHARAMVSLEDALTGAVDNLRETIEGADAEVTYDALPHVAGDASQMIRLFQNLVGNAVKFRGTRAPRIHISAEERDADWLISVTDNGIGIAPEDTDRIFGMFKRLHTPEEIAGTGMGLALCRRIVERHGGRIWASGEPERGSTFYVSLPRGPAAELN